MSDVRVRLVGFLLSLVPSLFCGDARGQNPELPPEMRQLKAQRDEAIDKVDAPLKPLGVSYRRHLETLQDTARSSGSLSAMIEVLKEKERVRDQAAGRDSDWEELASLQQTYHEELKALKEKGRASRVRIEKVYVEELTKIKDQYVRSGEIAFSNLAIRELRSAEARLSQEIGQRNLDPSMVAFDWTRLEEMVARGRLSETEPVGGSSGDDTRDLPEKTALLVGFEVYLNPFRDSDSTVRRIIPIYRDRDGRTFEGVPRSNAQKGDKSRHVAKDGYVVGGIETVSEAGIRKMKIIFHQIQGMGTTEEDAYDSGWLGEWNGGREASMTTKGRLPVGVNGFIGLGVGEIRLIVADPDRP